MRRKTVSPIAKNLFLALGALVVLSGCWLEETPDPAEVVPEDEPNNTGEILREHTLVGSVGDGPIVGAEVRVLTFDGEILGVADSTSDASFSIVVKTRGSYYPLRIVAEGGTDLVTASTPDFTMRSSVLKPGNRSQANINPFTTMAVKIAAQLPGGQSEKNVADAIDIVVRELGSGLDSIVENGPLETPIDGANIAEMVKASEALGETIRRTRDALRAVGRNMSGNEITRVLGSDLADGVIDGRGGPNADARTAAVATIVIAQVMLESITNELRVLGTNATARMTSAMNQVYAGTISPSLDELRVTPAMLDAAQVGLLAVSSLQPSGTVNQLLSQLDQVQSGMTVTEAASILDATPAATVLDNVALAVAGGSFEDIETVNNVARSGALAASNQLPAISGQPPASVSVGTAYSFTPTASDADGDNLSFSISGRPAWATFDGQTGELAGTPGNNDVGSDSGIVISVSDGSDSASLPPFSITVLAGASNVPPQIGGTPATNVTAGNSYNFLPSANDPDGDTLAFSISNAPSWANFNTQNGRLSGTPDSGDVGTYSGISISVTDGEDSDSLPTFSIQVQPVVAGNGAPSISGTPQTTVGENEQYRFEPQASDPDGDSLSFSISNAPSWASFDTDSGVLQGTPSASDVGTYANIVIAVSDGQANDSLAPFTITVEAAQAANAAPEISGNPPGAVVVDNNYVFQPQASDDDGDALTFSIENSPPWAAFDTSNGRLSGTPEAVDVGVYGGISITVSDGEDSATLGPFEIAVDAVTLGSATLAWVPPTQNEDGSPLTNLAGYRIYWGTSPGVYTESVTLNNPGLTTYVVENLTPATYEFVTTAINTAGMESDYSNPATKTVP